MNADVSHRPGKMGDGKEVTVETAPATFASTAHAGTIRLLPSEHETARIAKLAALLAQTEFVPRSLRGKPEAIIAAILTGREMGILPMRALRQIAMVDGKPSPMAELVMALVLKEGHRMEVIETTHEHCVVEVQRSDWPDGKVQRLEWTLDDAVRAGLCRIDPDTKRPVARDSNGRPMPWERYPRAMLRSRCVAEAGRAWLPDVVEGYSYSPEELGADVDANGHARELVDLADGNYNPLDGVPAEVRAKVEASFGDDGEDAEGEVVHPGSDDTEASDEEPLVDDSGQAVADDAVSLSDTASAIRDAADDPEADVERWSELLARIGAEQARAQVAASYLRQSNQTPLRLLDADARVRWLGWLETQVSRWEAANREAAETPAQDEPETAEAPTDPDAGGDVDLTDPEQVHAAVTVALRHVPQEDRGRLAAGAQEAYGLTGAYWGNLTPEQASELLGMLADAAGEAPDGE